MKGESMEVGQLHRTWFELIKSFFHEGFLDEQFAQLQQLQDESNPDFVFEVVTLFFDDSEKLLNDLARALDQQTVDFIKVDSHVHQLKGSSSSIGAQRVKNVCITFRNYCDQNNREGCLRCVQQVKHECSLVKNKLESLFRQLQSMFHQEKQLRSMNDAIIEGMDQQSPDFLGQWIQLEQQILAAGGSVPVLEF